MRLHADTELQQSLYRTAGNGLLFPALGLGTSRLRGKVCRQTLEDALDLGYRLFDTAWVYDNECDIGNSIESSGLDRQEIRLCTKLYAAQLLAGHATDAVKKSLERLRTDHVDLLLLHWPCTSRELPEIMKRLRAAKAAGLAKAIGLSNAPRPFFDTARQGAEDIAANQIERHLLLQHPQLAAHMRISGALLMAYRPTARGAAAQASKVISLASRLGCTAHQVALAWHFVDPNAVVIAGASRRDHLEENLASLKLHLSRNDIGDLTSIDEGRRTLSRPYAPEWPEDRANSSPCVY